MEGSNEENPKSESDSKAMIEKVVRKAKLSEFNEIEENLKYWLSKSPEERVAAVEYLRQQHYGVPERLQRTARIIQLSQS